MDDTGASDQAAPVAELAPSAVWTALRAHAEPNSPLDRNIDRTTAELAERGVAQSGIAIKAAHELAYDRGLVWDASLRRFIERDHPPSLSDDQRHAVTEAARHFAATGEWPKVGDVVRELARRDGSTGTRQAVQSLPSNMGYESDHRLVLTAEGLALSGHGSEILQALVEFARMAAEIYVGNDDPPIITSTSVTAAVGEEPCNRLNTVLNTERFLVGSGHNNGD